MVTYECWSEVSHYSDSYFFIKKHLVSWFGYGWFFCRISNSTFGFINELHLMVYASRFYYLLQLLFRGLGVKVGGKSVGLILGSLPHNL